MNVSLIPSNGQQHISPFTSITTTPQNNAKIASIEAIISCNKTTINWKVEDNQLADLFELEKSADGKNFSMAALIFGTDKQETGNYEFYEKTGKNSTVFYRIKLVNKNKKAEFSQIVQAKIN